MENANLSKLDMYFKIKLWIITNCVHFRTSWILYVGCHVNNNTMFFTPYVSIC